MLTRLKVSGFKNLVDVDVRFGPFTCIAGANAVGKSNLFDAIHFLSELAGKPLIEAATSLRGGRRSADVRNLFHQAGDSYSRQMAFEAEMIVPADGLDDLGQVATASVTFLRYALELAYDEDATTRELGPLRIVREELRHHKKRDAHRHLLFDLSAAAWRDQVVGSKSRAAPFISTETEGSKKVIKLHQDGGSRGKPVPRLAESLPRTVLSSVNAAESPTALLAKLEMQSWRMLHLEPAALREPDDFNSPPRLSADGSHLPAALYHLAHRNGKHGSDPDPEATYQQVANRLADLIDDVRMVSVERDPKRELFTLQVVDNRNTSLPARALSDGTLRFLALAVLELETNPRGLLCLEEPENGIHPARIPTLLELLKDIAVDPTMEPGPDNPLRQVVINTHSPVVVGSVSEDDLLCAELMEAVRDGERFNRVRFTCLTGTWRTRAEAGATVMTVSKGKLLSYLNPLRQECKIGSSVVGQGSAGNSRRVADREDLQQLLPFSAE